MYIQELLQYGLIEGVLPHYSSLSSLPTPSEHVSVGALGDSFYEYLLKSWLMTSKNDVEARDMYYAAVEVCALSLCLWWSATVALAVVICMVASGSALKKSDIKHV